MKKILGVFQEFHIYQSVRSKKSIINTLLRLFFKSSSNTPNTTAKYNSIDKMEFALLRKPVVCILFVHFSSFQLK